MYGQFTNLIYAGAFVSRWFRNDFGGVLSELNLTINVTACCLESVRTTRKKRKGLLSKTAAIWFLVVESFASTD